MREKAKGGGQIEQSRKAYELAEQRRKQHLDAKTKKPKHESHLTISLIIAPEYDLLLAIHDSI